MIKRFRRWLFKQLMGVDAKDFERFASLMSNMDERWNELEAQIIITSKAILEISDQTGGKGWVEAVQNAIANLDNRVYKLHEVAAAHQEAFEELAEAHELIEEVEDKGFKDLN